MLKFWGWGLGAPPVLSVQDHGRQDDRPEEEGLRRASGTALRARRAEDLRLVAAVGAVVADVQQQGAVQQQHDRMRRAEAHGRRPRWPGGAGRPWRGSTCCITVTLLFHYYCIIIALLVLSLLSSLLLLFFLSLSLPGPRAPQPPNPPTHPLGRGARTR